MYKSYFKKSLKEKMIPSVVEDGYIDAMSGLSEDPIADFSKEALQFVKNDVDKFVRLVNSSKIDFGKYPNIDSHQLGVLFHSVRNSTGLSFTDDMDKEDGIKLNKLAKKFKPHEDYIGDDGNLYIY